MAGVPPGKGTALASAAPKQMPPAASNAPRSSIAPLPFPFSQKPSAAPQFSPIPGTNPPGFSPFNLPFSMSPVAKPAASSPSTSAASGVGAAGAGAATGAPSGVAPATPTAAKPSAADAAPSLLKPGAPTLLNGLNGGGLFSGVQPLFGPPVGKPVTAFGIPFATPGSVTKAPPGQASPQTSTSASSQKNFASIARNSVLTTQQPPLVLKPPAQAQTQPQGKAQPQGQSQPQRQAQPQQPTSLVLYDRLHGFEDGKSKVFNATDVSGVDIQAVQDMLAKSRATKSSPLSPMAEGLQSPLGQNSMQLRSIPSSSTPNRPAASTNSTLKGQLKNAANELSYFIPGVGQARSAYDTYTALRDGRYVDAAVSAMGVVPVGRLAARGGKLLWNAGKRVAPKLAQWGGQALRSGQRTLSNAWSGTQKVAGNAWNKVKGWFGGTLKPPSAAATPPAPVTKPSAANGSIVGGTRVRFDGDKTIWQQYHIDPVTKQKIVVRKVYAPLAPYIVQHYTATKDPNPAAKTAYYVKPGQGQWDHITHHNAAPPKHPTSSVKYRASPSSRRAPPRPWPSDG